MVCTRPFYFHAVALKVARPCSDTARIPLSLSVVLCSWEACKVVLPTSDGYFLGLFLQW